MVLQVKLSADNTQRLDELSRQTGKTREELVNEALECFAIDAEAEEHRTLLAWREAARRIAGIWKDRDDLPDFDELRKSWDRGYVNRK